MTVRAEGIPEVMWGPNEEGMREALDTFAECLTTIVA
jgi:hypothetical protein